MADHLDHVAIKAWSLGRATVDQRGRMVGPLLRGEPAVAAAHGVAVLPPRTVDEDVVPAAYSRAFEAAIGRARQDFVDSELEARAEARLLAELDVLDPDERRSRTLALPLSQRTPTLVERLATEGYERRFGAPELALPWTELAVELAGALDNRHGARRCSEARALAWAYHGNALRIASRLSEAEQAFAAARSAAEGGVGDVARRAERLRLESTLAASRSRFDSAAAALSRAAELCREGGDRVGEARVLLASATLALSSGRPAEALELLERAELQLVAIGDSRRALVARHDRLAALIDLHRFDEALPLFSELREHYDPERDRQDLIRLAWLEGRALAGLGRFSSGEARLREVRELFLAEKLLLDAAFVTLDLAGILLRQHRWAELAANAAAMAHAFAQAGTHREAAAALELLAVAGRQGEADEALLARVRETLEP